MVLVRSNAQQQELAFLKQSGVTALPINVVLEEI